MALNGAMVEKSADQTTANYSAAGTMVAFNAEIYDVGGWHDNATNNTRLTVPSGVDYVIVTGNIRIDLMANASTFSLSINKNGSRFTDGSPRVLTYNDTSATVALSVSSGPIPVTAGDYFELEFNVPDTSVTIVAARTNFSIRAVA